MLYRNLVIAREIVNLASDYEGGRIVVIIDAAHKPDLDLFLVGTLNIVIRHASEWGTVDGGRSISRGTPSRSTGYPLVRLGKRTS